MFKILIGLILGGLSYAFLPFDTEVNKGFVVFIMAAYFWISEALPLSITALLIPLLAALLGIQDVKSALGSFAHPIIFLFFGGFALATALQHYKLDSRIAQGIVKLGRGNSLTATFFLFAVTAFLSMWISNTATTAMMLPLAIGLLGSDTQNSNQHFVLLGLAYSASLGGIATIIGSPPNAIAAAALDLDFQAWMSKAMPVAIVLLLLCWVILYLIFSPSNTKATSKPIQLPKLSHKEYGVLSIFALCAGMWIFSRPLSSVIGVSKYFDALVAIFAVIALCSSKLLSWKEIEKNTDWGVLLLFGGGLALSGVLKASGASTIMADGISGLLSGAHIFIVLLLVCLFVIFLTELSSNTATAALLIPLFMSAAPSLGMSSIALTLIIGIAASCAFMLPVATPPNAIVFGSGKINQRTMMRAGLILNLKLSVILTVLVYLLD